MKNVTRRNVVTALAAIPVVAASGAVAAASAASVPAISPAQPGGAPGGQIDWRLAELPPLERHYAYEQVRQALEGKPSYLWGDKEAYWTTHFEQWKSELAPWFKDIIVGGEMAA